MPGIFTPIVYAILDRLGWPIPISRVLIAVLTVNFPSMTNVYNQNYQVILVDLM
jgi:hypothetical protein